MTHTRDAVHPLLEIRKRLQQIVPLLLILLVSGCGLVNAPTHVRIALFAPFEGRYSEVGYNALYAARLAIHDNANAWVDLLAVDDGGTEAASHASAFAQDPLVMAAIVLGYDGTSPETLKAFGDIPVLVVGDWDVKPIGDSVFILSNPKIDDQITASARIRVADAAQNPAPVTGGEVFALAGFAKLRGSLDGVTVLSSGSLPDADFARRYKASDQFTPEPGLLATLSYDTTMMAARAAQSGARTAARDFIGTTTYDGINGTIHFTNGYWDQAPMHTYQYVNGALTENGS